MYKMATAGVPSGTILAVTEMFAFIKRNKSDAKKKEESFSIIKPLMPALIYKSLGKTTPLG
jgi:hypothetical protein